jgi:hypothetical protein
MGVPARAIRAMSGRADRVADLATKIDWSRFRPETVDDIAAAAKASPPDAPVEVPVPRLGLGKYYDGDPGSLEVSVTTPRKLLDNLTGDSDYSNLVADRIVRRNSGPGAKAIEDPELFMRSLDEPVTQILAPEGTSLGKDTDTSGTWDAVNRTIMYDRTADPDHPNSTYEAGEINPKVHEEVHSIIQPEPGYADTDALESLAVVGKVGFNPTDDNVFNHFASSKRELVNLLFNIKQFGRHIYGEDFGASRKASNRLGKKIMSEDPNYDVATDTYVDETMMDGWERMTDILRQAYRQSNDTGKKYIRDLMHKAGMVGAASTILDGADDPLNGLREEQ